MTVHRVGVSGLIAAKVADVLSTGYALTSPAVNAHEGNGIAREVMHTIGVWPAMILLSLLATAMIVGVCEYYASKGYVKTRAATYSVVIVMWSVVAVHNVLLISTAL